MSEILDQDARDLVVGKLEQSFSLTAGAGSGKTTVLVQRLIRVLASGVPPRRVGAITFTEKAAGELRYRARRGLEEVLASTSDAERAATIKAALDAFSELTLSTIHAFCRELLVSESLTAGFAPATSAAEGQQLAPQLKQAMDAWFTGFSARHPAEARLLFAITSSTQRGAAAALIAAHPDLDLVADNRTLDIDAAYGELQELRERIEAGFNATADPDSCKLCIKARPLAAYLADVITQEPARAVFLALLTEREVKPGRLGNKKDWPDQDAKARFVDALREFTEWMARWRATVHGTVVRDIREHFPPLFHDEKRRAGGVIFDDLLVQARDLLRDDDSARARLSNRFDALLVDEVQDTDPIQAEVAMLLCRSAEHTSAWESEGPLPGKLFAVGDEKQSIYRFRGADVSTFTRLTKVIERQGDSTRLLQNFRSVPGIVRWVNHTFGSFDAYVSQFAFRDEGLLDPIVCLVPDEDDKGEEAEEQDRRGRPSAEEKKQEVLREVDVLLRHLQDLRAAGAEVFDKDEGAYRPFRYSDLMILLPSWSRADLIADHIRKASIPCSVEGGKQFFLRDEIRLCLAFLKCMVEPGDSESVAFLLRGMFGVSLEQLAKHRADGGGFRFTIRDQPVGPAAEAMIVLRRLYITRGQTSLASLLLQVLDASRAAAVWSLLPDGRRRLANVDKLCAIVHDLEDEAISPIAVLEELRAIAKRSEAKDLSLAAPDSDAVRVTTLFKAKGLEAPVVALLCADRKPMPPSAIIDRAGGRLAVRLSSRLEPPGWDDMKEVDQTESEAERRRWMYVACTRARDQLIITHTAGNLLGADIKPNGLFSLDGKEHDGAYLPEGTEDAEPIEAADDAADTPPPVRLRLRTQLDEVTYTEEAFGARQAEVDALLAEGVSAQDTDGSEREVALREKTRAAARQSLKWKSVSEDVANKRDRRRMLADEPAYDPLRVGKRGGTVIHEVMERAPLIGERQACIAAALELLEPLAVKGGLDEEKTEACGRVIEKIYAHPRMEDVQRAPYHWREVPFAYQKSARNVVTGIIDLLFPIDDSEQKWIVVDWKSHVPPEGHPLHERYRHQLQHYTRAVLATVGKQKDITVDAFLIGPHPDVEPAEDTADEALENLLDPGLRAVLSRLLSRGAPIPQVGLELEEADGALLEMAFSEATIGLAFDVPEASRKAAESAGWRVVAGNPDEEGVYERIERELAEALELSDEPEVEQPLDEDPASQGTP